MEFVAEICYSAMQSSKFAFRFPSATRGLLFPRQFLVCRLDSISILTEEQRRHYVFVLIFADEESLESKIEAGAFTRPDFDFGHFHFAGKEDVNITEIVPLDRDLLDSPFDFAALEELICPSPCQLHLVAVYHIPTRHIVGERFVLDNLLELRRRAFLVLLQVLEKQLVGSFDADRDILDSMSRKLLTESVSRLLLELREMLLQSINRRALMEYSVVVFVQSDAVIVDDACNIYLLIQVFILLGLVELELIGLSH